MELKIFCENIGYKEHEALIKKVDLKIAKTGFFKIEGSNGSGKSTLFKALNGELDWINSNNIQISIDNKTIDVYKNRQILFLSDTFEGYLYLKPSEYIYFISELYKKKINKEYMLFLFKTLDFSQYSHYLIKDLSQGNKQKLVFITSALISCPIILFDEAYEHIDKKTIAHIKTFIKDRFKDNFVFLTSHTTIIDDIIADSIYLKEKQLIYNSTRAEKNAMI